MKKILFAAVACLALAGCVSHEFNGGQLKSVSDVHFQKTNFKKGRACSSYLFPVYLPILGWAGIPLGDEDRVLTAIQKGRIDTVEFAEYTSEYYIIFGRQCVDVYGQ